MFLTVSLFIELINYMYRFKGEYEIDVQQSYKQKCLVWKRIAKRVKTYPPKN